jgi:tetratricopeptide (TPR) repeat protein
MAPAVIPWELVEACRLPELEVEEGSAFGDQQAELLRAQFLERSGPGLYQLHPLVRQFLRQRSQEQPEVVVRWRKQLAAAVAGVCRERIPETLTLELVVGLETFLPHIRLVGERMAEELEVEDLIWPSLALARVAEHQGIFAEALRWREEVVMLCEKRRGPQDPTTATALNNLAVHLLKTTNHLVEAERLVRRALAIDEATLGPNHLNVARDLNTLAGVFHDTNRHEEAEFTYRRALAIYESSDEAYDTNLAPILTNLSQLLQATGRPEEAEPLVRRALAIDENSYGINHVNVALRLSTLAQLLQDTNRLVEAEQLMRRALAISEISFGPNHPAVANELNNLAALLHATAAACSVTCSS